MDMERAPQDECYCQMCCSDVWARDIVKFDGKSHCICKYCIKTFLENNINKGNVFSLLCPHCPKQLTYNIIKNLVDPESVKQFEKLILSKIVDADPLKRECPNSNCRIPFILPQQYKRKAECSACKALLCTKCNKEYHKGSCRSIFENEVKYWENKEEFQMCSFCKTIITKSNGCDHMTCSVCGHEWCWLCGGRYEFHDIFNPFGCQILPSYQSSSPAKKALRYFVLFFWAIFVILTGLTIGAPLVLYKNKKETPEVLQRHCSLLILSYFFALILQPIFDAVVLVGLIPYAIIRIIPNRKKQKKIQLQNIAQNRELVGLGITKIQLNRFKQQT